MLVHVDHDNQAVAQHRFQGKLSIPFGVSLWNMMRKQASKHKVFEFDKERFSFVMDNMPETRLQSYENDFVLRLLEHVDRPRVGKVNIADLTTIVMFLSYESDLAEPREQEARVHRAR